MPLKRPPDWFSHRDRGVDGGAAARDSGQTGARLMPQQNRVVEDSPNLGALICLLQAYERYGSLNAPPGCLTELGETACGASPL